MPLTPSFVGSNPATPAKDTIYCIRNVLPNTIYGFCFIWLVFLFPKLGKEMGKLFGLNFVFCPAFQPVLSAYAGFFVLLLLFQKIGLGKLLSVNYLCKAFPKFPIAPELQIFQYRILSAWEILCVGACHDIFPSLFGRVGVAFQILHCEPLFAVA